MRLRLLTAPFLLVLGAACAAPEPAKPAPPLRATAAVPAAPAEASAAPPEAASTASPSAANEPADAPDNPVQRADTDTSATPQPITSVNHLTLALLRALEAERGNVFYSATSLRSALGMTALGARRKTLEELTRALHLDPDPVKNAEDARIEADEWKRAAGKAELHIANRLFVQRGLVLAQEFSARTLHGYGASTGLVDFASQTERSRIEINRWVSDRTKQRIPELLPPSSLDTQTRMVLTNAIYFKGQWLSKFDKASTKDEPFHAPSGTLPVPTMHRTSRIAYGETDEVRLVDLPYEHSELVMLIALPAESTTLAKVVRDLTPDKLTAWAGSLRERQVSLYLPKLEYSWGGSVKQQLLGLGIRDAFSDGADFSAMLSSGKDALYVDDVFHKGFVLVDEAGTEAAAATGVVMRTKSAALLPLELRVDRPYLFFIRNAKTGDVLFAGRVLNPKEKG